MKTLPDRLFVPRKIVRGLFILASASVILCGCATTHTWIEEAGASSSELTKITCDREQNYQTYIIKTDGKPMRCDLILGTTQTVFVKPGLHTFFIGYEKYLGESHAFRTVYFNVEAGKSYAVHRKLEDYHVVLSVEDLSTGKTVGDD